MNKSRIFKINIPLLVIVFISICTFAVTQAFFSASAQSDNNIFASGTLELTLEQTDVLEITDWTHGQEHTMEFTVKNTGSMPIYVKGYLEGIWDDANLDPTLFEVIAVEHQIDDTWVNIMQGGVALGDEFYLSADGSPDNLLAIPVHEQVKLRLTTRLSEQAGNEYQEQVFRTSLHVAGRQVQESASWPESY